MVLATGIPIITITIGRVLTTGGGMGRPCRRHCNSIAMFVAASGYRAFPACPEHSVLALGRNHQAIDAECLQFRLRSLRFLASFKRADLDPGFHD